ncbi:hypothetical protein BZARG_3077 [Bizionia argentinensis JUB59]|uniref:Uncharacterized protein n=1 Tax=Bizionia argentinensis JUB59 TaxID=1046627 RepID=G2EEQ4_9FLAO|nr:hypothetical protein [Bizionia argentinensis]EGV43087.1 hypothetical protein BZARG_3077 [Bizionia argentinensis JUB59]
MKYKKLVRIQVVMIIFQVVSVLFMFWYGIKFYAYQKLLRYADRLEPKILVIDTIKTFTKKSGYTAFAHGYINGEDKSLSLDFYKRNDEDSYIKESIGDTLLVWSATGIRSVEHRKLKEKSFNKKKYKKVNRNSILFVFLPIILVWVSERIVTKKIKQLKKENKS